MFDVHAFRLRPEQPRDPSPPQPFRAATVSSYHPQLARIEPPTHRGVQSTPLRNDQTQAAFAQNVRKAPQSYRIAFYRARINRIARIPPIISHPPSLRPSVPTSLPPPFLPAIDRTRAWTIFPPYPQADVAELADALVSGTSGGNSMEVRVLSSAVTPCFLLFAGRSITVQHEHAPAWRLNKSTQILAEKTSIVSVQRRSNLLLMAPSVVETHLSLARSDSPRRQFFLQGRAENANPSSRAARALRLHRCRDAQSSLYLECIADPMPCNPVHRPCRANARQCMPLPVWYRWMQYFLPVALWHCVRHERLPRPIPRYGLGTRS